MAWEVHHQPHNQSHHLPCSAGLPTSRTPTLRSRAPVTLYLLRSLSAATPAGLDRPGPATRGWGRCLDLKIGNVYYRGAEMSRNNGKGAKVDLKLNLSAPPRSRGGPSRAVAADDSSPHRSSSSSSSSSPSSPPSSCVSSESDQGQKQSSSPEATSMVLAGCPRCLMYVMLSEKDPKCPKCKSTVLLDFNTTRGS